MRRGPGKVNSRQPRRGGLLVSDMKALPTVIVLAAGGGFRFTGAGHKLAQPMRDSTVLGTTLDQVVSCRLPAIVITTAALADLAARHVASRDVIVLPQVDSNSPEPLGMGYSIAAGVAARANSPGWLILPADMPLVQPSTLLAVASQLEHHAAAFAQYRGRRGHPVGFSAELYSELIVLSGGDGAKRLLSRYPAVAVEVDDRGVLLDIDTESDLSLLRRIAAGSPEMPHSPSVPSP